MDTIPVEFASLPGEVLATPKHAGANPDGVRLSPVDCMLLGAVAGKPSVDVMTEDKTLKDVIGAECGAGRTRAEREKYQRQNARTAWFIGAVAGDDSTKRRTADGMAACPSLDRP